MYDIENWIKSIQDKVNISIKHSNELQNIVNYMSFSLEDIIQYYVGEILPYWVQKGNLNKNSPFFDITIYFFIAHFKNHSHISYFYVTSSSNDLMLFCLPSNIESQLYNKLIRIEKLKLFL